MRAAFLLIMMGCTLVAADDPSGWMQARWEMTPDQAAAAVPESQRTVKIGSCSWKANFRFTQSGLSEITLDETDPVCVSLAGFLDAEQLLVEKYGHPLGRADAETRASLWTLGTTTIRLQLTLLKSPVRLETLLIRYSRVTSSDLDNCSWPRRARIPAFECWMSPHLRQSRCGIGHLI